jgi:geranylgeranyl pyrophosphate synthase
MPTMSGFLEKTIVERFPHIQEDYNERITDIAQRHPSLGELFKQHARFRAAYVIAQLFIEVSYKALTGHAIEVELRRRSAAFSLMCLCLGIADDLVDLPTDFDNRMGLGCLALAILDYAYNSVADDPDANRRRIFLKTLSSFAADAIIAGQQERRYARERQGSLEAYIEITSKKTTLYTRHSLHLSHSLSKCSPVLIHPIERLGHSAGMAIQILDDLLDAKTEPIVSGQPITYPSMLLGRGERLDPVHSLLERELLDAIGSCRDLPFPDDLISLLVELQFLIAMKPWM